MIWQNGGLATLETGLLGILVSKNNRDLKASIS